MPTRASAAVYELDLARPAQRTDWLKGAVFGCSSSVLEGAIVETAAAVVETTSAVVEIASSDSAACSRSASAWHGHRPY